MKATLEFNLDEPEDRESHLRCIHALDLALTLWKIQEELRKAYKHGEDVTKEALMENVWAVFKDMPVSLDELVS